MTAFHATCQTWIVHRWWSEHLALGWINKQSGLQIFFFFLKTTYSHEILFGSYMDFLKAVK